MDYKTLVIKNIPKNFQISKYFKENYNAIGSRYFGRARAVVRFENQKDAKTAMINLHQTEINNHIISVEYLGKCELDRANHKNNTTEKTVDSHKNIQFAKKLLAISEAHGFHHAPLPHLKYSYPKINRDILDAISIQLMTNTKFYTQVLHLMNRMNLEPPFLERRENFFPPGELKNVQTQTDFEKLEKLLASDESELESSDKEYEEPKLKRLRLHTNLEDNKKIKAKLKKVLKCHSLVKKVSCESKHNVKKNLVFETPEKIISNKISVNVSAVRLFEGTVKTATERVNESHEHSGYNEENKCPKKEISFASLEENRIPEIQLKEMPIYKNYQKGELSNKLYIKNLAKDVTVDDLKQIYKLFVNDIETELETKVMQNGRMKGQAFVTFLKLIKEKDLSIVEKALKSTNGFILKKKPLIVCFGKK